MRITALFLALLLVSCTGTSPEPRYYALSTVPGGVQVGTALMIKISRPSLPGYLDRPDIVRQESAYEYKVNEFQRWAEPLDRMFARILAEDLRQRLPDSVIVTEGDASDADIRYVVETSIERFNAIDDKSIRLHATLTIIDKTGVKKFPQQPLAYYVPTGASPEQIASGLSMLIGLYAEHIVTVFASDETDSADGNITP